MTDPSRSTLYVHVPFCVVKCGYCDFHSLADRPVSEHDAFVTGLDTELRKRAPADPPTVFLGGGTPTFLDVDRFTAMLDVLGRHVDLHACPEVTMEANPESLTEEKASIARDAGVNRFSVGAQTFEPTFLRFLDRAHDAAGIERAVGALRAADAENLSLDLMFGLPGQTLAQWQDDLSRALELGPDHLSCYNLTFEPGTKLTHAMERGDVSPNPGERDLAMFEWTRRELLDRGFTAYEISNFAGRGGPCRHNDHYWLQGNYVGVGPGAASHADGERATNFKPISRWAAAVDAGPHAFADVERLTPRQRAGEAVWLGLRRADGVDLRVVEDRTGVDVAAVHDATIEKHVRAGDLVRDGDRIALTAPGIRLADSIAVEFLDVSST